jgi:ABC-2 type transport system permease protein
MKKISVSHKPSQFVAYLSLVKGSILSSLRNPSSLFFNFFFPFIFISIFGILGSGGANFDVAVTNDSLKEGLVYEKLTQIEVLNLITNKSDSEIQEDLNKGRIPASLTVKQNGMMEVSPGVKMPRYTVTINKSAADPINANTVLSIINSVTDSINLYVFGDTMKMVEQTVNTVEGRKYSQIDFILPGQLAFALLTNALFGIAFTFMSFRKELILKRYFASPVKKITILASEATSKTIIAMLQAIIIITLGHLLFKFTLADGLTTFIYLLVLSLVGTFTFLSFGLLIPSLAKTEDGISPVANLIMMPQLFLSGAFFPIDAFPEFLQPIARIMPMTFLNEAFKKVAFEGAGLDSVLPNIGALFLWGIIIYIIDIFIFKWE